MAEFKEIDRVGNMCKESLRIPQKPISFYTIESKEQKSKRATFLHLSALLLFSLFYFSIIPAVHHILPPLQHTLPGLETCGESSKLTAHISLKVSFNFMLDNCIIQKAKS